MTRSQVDAQHSGVCSRHPIAVVLLQLVILAAIMLWATVLVASGTQELALTEGTAPVLVGFALLAPALVAYLVVSRKASVFGSRAVRRGRWLAYSPAALVFAVTIAADGFYLDQSTPVMGGGEVQ